MKFILSGIISLLFSSMVSGQATLPYLLDFETATFPPANCDLFPIGTPGWERNTAASGYGIGTACMSFDNFTNTTGNFDIRLPHMNLSHVQLPYIRFDVAYAMSPTSVNSDAFGIWWSPNGTSAWQNLQNYYGNTLVTALQTPNPYVPVAAEWRTTLFPLTFVAGQPYVRIQLRDECFNSNILYIDNILVFDSAAVHTGVDNISADNQFTVYPNPSNGVLHVKNNSANTNAQLSIYNLMGELIYTSVLSDLQNEIDISSFPSEVYLYKISSNEKFVMAGKIVTY